MGAEIVSDPQCWHPMQRLLQATSARARPWSPRWRCCRRRERWQAAMMAPTEIPQSSTGRSSARAGAPGHRRRLAVGRSQEGARARPSSPAWRKRRGAARGRQPMRSSRTRQTLPRLALGGRRAAPLRRAPAPGALREKGEGGRRPQHGMMSATPIPRTLAMTHTPILDVGARRAAARAHADPHPPGLRGRVATRSSSVRAACLEAARLTGVPADRGVRGAATADRAGHLRDAGRGAPGIAHRAW